MPSTAAGPEWPTWFEVQAAELLDRTPRDVTREAVVPQVAAQPDGTPAHLPGQFLGLLLVDIDDGYGRAIARENPNAGPAHSRRGRRLDADLLRDTHDAPSSRSSPRAQCDVRYISTGRAARMSLL
jgi:hypothetical protein